MKPFFPFLILACMAGGARAADHRGSQLGDYLQTVQSSVPVCGSIATIEADDYVWLWSQNEFHESRLYSLYYTGEEHPCGMVQPSLQIVEIEKGGFYLDGGTWRKFKKIHKPIDWTDTYLSTSTRIRYGMVEGANNFQIGVNRETGEVVARRRNNERK